MTYGRLLQASTMLWMPTIVYIQAYN